MAFRYVCKWEFFSVGIFCSWIIKVYIFSLHIQVEGSGMQAYLLMLKQADVVFMIQKGTEVSVKHSSDHI